jgi:hypothetical protein
VSRAEGNLLLRPEVRGAPEVQVALECALRYALADSDPETLCFLSFGTDDEGERVDPPRELLERLSDLEIAVLPRSAVGHRRDPPGALCTVELTEWVPGLQVRFFISVAMSDWPALRGFASVATVANVSGTWTLVYWPGERRWSPN